MVDPQRDIDRVSDLADVAGVHITHVVEAHIHNDYVTGGGCVTATPSIPLINTMNPLR